MARPTLVRPPAAVWPSVEACETSATSVATQSCRCGICSPGAPPGVSNIAIEVTEALLEQRLAVLEGARSWSPRVVSKLEAQIRTADDADLFRINPMRYGSRHGVDEAEVIDLFLFAADCGLFDMDWLIVCGACANVFKSFRKLESIDPHFVCNLCSMENTAALDDLVQVTFTVSPHVRTISFHDPDALSADELYFRYHLSPDVKPLSNGLTVPEVLRSWTRLLTFLDPDETATVDIEPRGTVGVMDVVNSVNAMFAVGKRGEEGGSLRLELDGSRLADAGGTPLGPLARDWPEGRSLYDSEPIDGPAAGGPSSEVEASRRTLSYRFPAVGLIPAGRLSLAVHNTGTTRASAWVVDYPPFDQMAFVEFVPILSAKKLISNQTFRRLFRSETAPETERLEVRDLTYLFTDLKDSTAMYDRIGDASAYDLVRRHFDALVRAVADNAGSVTKTIGDAVMATFVNPVDAVRAALDMHGAITDFNRTITPDLVIKVGIHRGRSIAVTLNDRIDFFGQDVNIAARVQKLADAGEIVLTADVYRDPDVANLLTPFDPAQAEGVMKGVTEKIPVYRVRAG